MRPSFVSSAARFLPRLCAVFAGCLLAAVPARAEDIHLWHAMAGELGRQLEVLVKDFNDSQSEYRVVPTYKGSYNETTTSAISPRFFEGSQTIAKLAFPRWLLPPETQSR